MICPKCASNNRDENAFCVKCGWKLIRPVEPTIEDVTSPSSSGFHENSGNVLSSQGHSFAGTNDGPVRKIGFKEAVANFFRNYVRFSGRATRSEYWYVVLFEFIIGLLFGLAGFILSVSAESLTGIMVLYILSGIFGLATILPSLSLCWRRMHDIGKSGLMNLLTLIPFVGSIIVLVLFCQPSVGDNEYGPRKTARSYKGDYVKVVDNQKQMPHNTSSNYLDTNGVAQSYAGSPSPQQQPSQQTYAPLNAYETSAGQKKNSSPIPIILATLGGVAILMAIVIGTVFITMKSQEDKEESIDAGFSQTATEQQTEAPIPEPEPDSEETVQSKALSPQTTQSEPEMMDTDEYVLEDVYYAVDCFLNAYIEDLNSGTYSAMYSAVESGSKMEQDQKSFIKGPLCEDLLNYTIVKDRKIDNNTYHVTTVEEYDVYNLESGNEYYFQQQCVYIVHRQTYGDWLVSGYAEAVKQLDKYVY